MDKLLDIQSRLNSGAYNPADYKKNAKFLQDKIAFMANRNSRGELRGKMGEAYALAKALLPRIEAAKPEGAVAPPVAAVRAAKKVMGVNEGAGAHAAPPVPVPVAKAKTARKKKSPAVAAAVANATLAPFNVPGMNNVSKLRIRIPGKTRRSPKAKAKKTPVNNMGGEGFWYNKPYPAPPSRRASKKRRAPRAKTAKKVRIESPLLAMNGNDYNRRIPASPNIIANEYMAQAAAEYEPMIPELYDPFTGEKFAREENPLPPIEKAYIMLKRLRLKTHRRAQGLRKTAKKAGLPAVPEAASILRANAGF